MEKYKVGKVLGDGTFGSVTKAINYNTAETVAIKRMKKKFFKWDDCAALPEIKSLIKFHHPNIVQLYEIIKFNNDLYFVFEFLDRNVYQMMKDRGKMFSEIQIRNIIYQTLQGLAYIHRHGYFHRDLKPENLLELNGIIKIADFGLAREIRSKPPFTDYVSTRWYRAPEVILRAPNYNSPIDVFAIGAIMAELFRFSPLFPGASEADQIHKICAVLGTPSKEEWMEGYKLASQIGFQFPKHEKQSLKSLIPTASENAISLISEMIKYNPNSRPSAIQALQHPFFQCAIPIPESFKPGVIAKYEDLEEIIPEKKILQRKKSINEEKKKGLKSGFYMRTARYRPGIKNVDYNNLFNFDDVFAE